MTGLPPSTTNDRYEFHEPVTPLRQSQRQQQTPSPPQPTHIEATAPGIYLTPPRQAASARQQAQPGQTQLTNDFEDELNTSTPLAPSTVPYDSPNADRRPHKALHISKNTASAILYTLEEALRHPYPFTADLVEENAQMSDFVGGGYPSANNGRTGSNVSLGRPADVPSQTGSPSGVRGPRAIMEERRARDARKKAEQEGKDNLERARAESEARLIQEERRQSAERRANAAAGAANPQRGSGETGPRASSGTTGQRISDQSQRSSRRPGERTSGGDQTLQAVGSGGSAMGGGATGGVRPRSRVEQREARARAQNQDPSQTPALPQEQPVPGSSRPRADTTSQPAPVTGLTAGEQAAQDARNTTRSSFPHAFERWETLSAHWEGLTSFWIRRLEENSREIARDPLSQQLSRQVTDLSAAGANLFHAVVELQRLRASSERKFQRWFFETRNEQERAQEIQALLEKSLGDERDKRVEAEARISQLQAQLAEAENRKPAPVPIPAIDPEFQAKYNHMEKRHAEMTRELQISKEEARRAWEELGRQEQVERERTASLRDGQPTMLGGVQVVPMMQGVPSRHTSARDRPSTKDGSHGAGVPVSSQHQPEDDDLAYQQYSSSQRADPLDPFVESAPAVSSSQRIAPGTSAVEYSQAPAVQPASSADFRQQQYSSVHPSQRDQYTPGGSDAGMSDEEYEIDDRGNFRVDSRGEKIRYRGGPVSDADTDEYDVTSDREREIAHQQRYGTFPVSQGPAVSSSASPSRTQAGTSRTEPDYAGQGYGSGWEAVPRHHHPTRLSDVIEEDERSRTSASQVSRRNF